jgi:putative holliday junction resolvase
MRILGIDYGTKRVGLALTDEDGRMGFPLMVVPNDSKLLSVITGVIEDKAVGEMVIGQSLGKDGSPNKIMAGIESLVTDLTLALPIPIHFEPEHYSTQAALRLQGRNEMTDAAAAALLLNSYLERKR